MPRTLPAIQASAHPRPSQLMLCDLLINLAQEADRAGYPSTAGRLITVLDKMFAEPTRAV